MDAESGLLDLETVDRRIAAWAHTTPNAPALTSERQTLTYGELDKLASKVGRRLIRNGARPEQVVGVYLERSVQAIVALLGILKTGAACLPISCDTPKERVEYMLADSRAAMVIAGSEVTGLPSEVKVLPVGTGDAEESAGVDAPGWNTTADNIAYVVYTSSATGSPKGVMRTHRAILSSPSFIPLRADDVCGHNVALNVAYSTVASFAPLLLGRQMVVIEEHSLRDLRQCVAIVADRGITTIAFVPSLLREFLKCVSQRRYQLPCLRAVAAYGEAMPEDIPGLFEKTLPHAELFIGYGASEAGVVTSSPGRARSGAEGVLVGRAVQNTEIYVLDDQLDAVPPGRVAEVYIASKHLARGYLGRPASTAERFVADPFGSGKRLYRTGDVGRKLQGGEVVLLGRSDTQVKVRGYRIELGEIRAALLRHPGVRHAQVIAERNGAETQIVAFVEMRSALTAGELRQHLVHHLPDYMLPARYVFDGSVAESPGAMG